MTMKLVVAWLLANAPGGKNKETEKTSNQNLIIVCAASYTGKYRGASTAGKGSRGGKDAFFFRIDPDQNLPGNKLYTVSSYPYDASPIEIETDK